MRQYPATEPGALPGTGARQYLVFAVTPSGSYFGAVRESSPIKAQAAVCRHLLDEVGSGSVSRCEVVEWTHRPLQLSRLIGSSDCSCAGGHDRGQDAG